MFYFAPSMRGRRVGRRGFTLLEMVIVLAILSAIALWTWPTLRRQFRTSQLRDAGRQIRAELARARQKAVATGTIQYFRFQPGGRGFEVERAPTLMETPEAPADLDLDETAQPNDRSDSTRDSGPHADRYELAEGIFFLAADWQPYRPKDENQDGSPDTDMAGQGDGNRTLPAEPDAPADDVSWSRPIVFYPNGRTTDARIRLANFQGAYLDVTMRGLTGTTTIGQVRHGKVQR